MWNKLRVWLLSVLLLVACGSLESGPTLVTVTKIWTAPGDDGMLGQASGYDGRYSTSLDSLENHWGACAPWPTPDIPAPSGQKDTSIFIITLESGVDYHFAIITYDEVPNISDISNDAIENVPDTIPPAPITDLQ